MAKKKISEGEGLSKACFVLVAEGGLLQSIKYITLFHLGMGGLIGLFIGGLIHGGFFLYKKITEKGKYIQVIENAKKELITSCEEIKKEINKNLETNKNQIESAVKKFEELFLSKNYGIKNHKEEWTNLFQQFKKLALNLKLIE